MSQISFADPQPRVGRKEAQKYFTSDAKPETPKSQGGDNVLMLYLGQYINSQAYSWGSSSPIEKAGQANYGVTYLFDEWHGMDLNLRVEMSEFSISNNRATKITFLPLVSFPRADSRFPLYFGLGPGLGIFMQQLSNKSNLSFDYQLVMGARFMELANGVGFFLEFGLKNHLHLLSDGQFNGTSVTAGAIFNF